MMIKIIAFIVMCYGCASGSLQGMDEEMNFLNHVQAFVKENDNQQPLRFDIEERVEKKCTLNCNLGKSDELYVVLRAFSSVFCCFNSCWSMRK